jgi:hypothetical protein
MNALKLTIGIVLFVSNTLMAQVTVTIGPPPPWGPVGFTEVRYYYLPDVETYYDVQSSRFIYYQTGNWIQSSQLPSRYKKYDLYDGYKIVMTGYRGNTPYDHFSEHQRDFKKGSYHGERQKTNGERSENSKDKGGNGKNKKNN